MESNYKTLRTLVDKMRKYQRQYYREKRKDALPKAIHYEKKVDEFLRATSMLEEAQRPAGEQITMELRSGPGGAL